MSGGAALAEQHWCGSCRRGPLSGALGCIKGACMEAHRGESLLLADFLSYGCVFFSAIIFSGWSSSPSVYSGFASFVLMIGAGATHPGRDEMAASIGAALMEAVGSGLGKEAVKTTASSQTSFQNLPPAKCSPGCCCHLCQAAPIPPGPLAWLPLHWHSSPLAERT